MDISKRIEQIRTGLGVSQKDMAENLNVSPPYYGRLEKRGDSLSIKQIKEIASCLGVEFESLIIPNFDKSQRQQMWLSEFFDITIIHWVHDYLPEIIKLFKHSLDKDNLTIKTIEDKLTLINFLQSKVRGEIVGNLLSIDLEKVLTQFLETRIIIIYYFSRREGIVWVDMINESDNHHRGFKKVHQSFAL